MAIQPTRHIIPTLPLHRKLLFPHIPPGQPLPVIVPGDSKDIQILNERLYHLVALVFRAYILSWLPRITKDQSLLYQINETILLPLLQPICTHLAEDPSGIIDLVLLDLPSLVTLHVQTYHAAKAARDSGINWDRPPIGEAYHARLPLLALEQDGSEYNLSPLWLTGAVEAIMRLYLVEEYDCLPERIMVRELVGRVVLGGVGRKISQPWFWWSLGLKLIPARGEIGSASMGRKAGGAMLDSGLRWIYRVWSGIMLAWTLATWTVVSLAATSPLRPRYRHCTLPTLRMMRSILVGPSWTLRILLATLELLLTFLSPIIDRIVPYLFETHLATPSMAIKLVDLLEKILFPLDGYPAPTPDDPSPEESAAMKRALELRISEVVPSLAIPFLPPPSTFLDPLSDASCNAHLVGMVYNAVIGCLIPELLAGQAALPNKS